ncbi:MAG: hypothetical protein V7756_06010 [Halopseudomonas sp.]|uniref:hypothetical protein n=1 Tax=Halopseudomonas sp. TaxID=2901191 RepID=UPI0030016DAC
MEAANQAKQQEQATVVAVEAKRGSLKDLPEDYTAELCINGVVSTKKIERSITPARAARP